MITFVYIIGCLFGVFGFGGALVATVLIDMFLALISD